MFRFGNLIKLKLRFFGQCVHQTKFVSNYIMAMWKKNIHRIYFRLKLHKQQTKKNSNWKKLETKWQTKRELIERRP